MADVRELGRKVKAKYPGVYDDLDDADLGRKVKAKHPGAYDDFTDTPAPAQEPEGVFSSFQTGVAGPLLRNVVETAADFYNAPGETLERVGRGALEFVSAFDPAGKAYQPTVQGQAERVAELNRRADERLPEFVKSAKVGMALEEAKPRTRAGRVAGAVGSVLGEVAFPTAPETVAGNVITAPFGASATRSAGTAFKSGVSAVRRAFGKGAAQIVEAEALPAAVAQVRKSIGEVPPTTGAASQIRRTGAVAESAPEQASTRAESGVARLEAPTPAQSLPNRPETPGAPPLLEVAEPKPFEVALGKERARQPGATGPRFDETVEMELRKQVDAPKSLIEAAERSPWQDTALAYFRANLLTSPVGRAVDLGGTIINQFADAATRPIAAAIDTVVSKLSGQRSITGPSLRGTGRAFGSIRQGLRDAGEVLKTGKQTIDSGADDALYGAETVSGLGKAVDVPVNGVFRILGALDAPFRRFGYARNLYDRARVAAINESRRGLVPDGQIVGRTRELLDDGDIIRAAVRDGEAAVLSEPNRISSWLAEQTASSPNARLAIGLVQPFMRIPLNAVLKAADFSGVGGVKALYKIARGVGRKTRAKPFFRDVEEQRVFAQNVAAGSFAPAALILGMELEDRGKLEGYYYTSKRDYPNGKVPTSINISGENYDINRLGGFVMAPLFIGATYNRLRKQDAGKADAFLRSFSGLVQTAPALGYYGVPAKAGRLLTSEEPGSDIAKEAGGIASGFIPASGAMGAAAKAIDPVKKRKVEGFTGPIMDRIPGLRQLLPEKWTGSPFIDGALEPHRPLFSELQRLNKRVSELRRKEGEKDDAFKVRIQQFGQNYTQFGLRLLQNPRFQSAPDDIKALALDSLSERAKRITRREFAFPEIELDANALLDSAESSKKNAGKK